MATVSRVLQAYYREGRIADLPRGGRERATSTEEDKLIVAACVVDPFLSAREIRDELELENVSVSTIRRRLHEAGIHSRIAAQKTLLDDRHRKQRMEFASVVESWCPQKWRSVVFTDEASICTRWDQQQRVWRPHACRYEDGYIWDVRSSGRTCVHVWGAISHDGLGPLHRISGRMTAETYSDIVEQVMLPYVLDGPFTDGVFLLQQDGAPIHTARSVTNLLDSLGIMRLDWPARSPDLNIIENVWAEIECPGSASFSLGVEDCSGFPWSEKDTWVATDTLDGAGPLLDTASAKEPLWKAERRRFASWTPVYEKRGPKWCIASPGGPRRVQTYPGLGSTTRMPFSPDTGKPRTVRRGRANPHGSGSVETPLSKHLLSQVPPAGP
ncbi:hypothetical protein ISCGN_019044 [Ixodes scapularis]